MKFLKWMKDGGPLSRTWGFFFVEIKFLFSFAILHFGDGARDSYHTHAFNAISWLVKGKLTEYEMNGKITEYLPSWKPIITPRETFHRVVSTGDSWAITFRGPWLQHWKEFLPEEKTYVGLTTHRKETWREPVAA